MRQVLVHLTELVVVLDNFLTSTVLFGVMFMTKGVSSCHNLNDMTIHIDLTSRAVSIGNFVIYNVIVG